MVKKFEEFVNEGLWKSETKIDECDTVSPNGGLTFGDVQGMGPIEFPGENPESPKGSGDLPMPSGKLYTQVQPFDSFLKAKWKKRKKKYKGETSDDNPIYKHSPNPDVYKYVYDFKKYIKNKRSGN